MYYLARRMIGMVDGLDEREARRIMLALLNRTSRPESDAINVLWCPCGAIADARSADGHGWDGWIISPRLECLCPECLEKNRQAEEATEIPQNARERYIEKEKQILKGENQ